MAIPLGVGDLARHLVEQRLDALEPVLFQHAHEHHPQGVDLFLVHQ